MFGIGWGKSSTECHSSFFLLIHHTSVLRLTACLPFSYSCVHKVFIECWLNDVELKIEFCKPLIQFTSQLSEILNQFKYMQFWQTKADIWIHYFYFKVNVLKLRAWRTRMCNRLYNACISTTVAKYSIQLFLLQEKCYLYVHHNVQQSWHFPFVSNDICRCFEKKHHPPWEWEE